MRNLIHIVESHLLEGGIKTYEIDDAMRSALKDAVQKYAHGIVKNASRDVDEKMGSSDNVDYSQRSAEIINTIDGYAHKDYFSNKLMVHVTDAANKVVRSHVMNVMAKLPKYDIKLNHWPDNAHKIQSSKYSVEVEIKEITNDPYSEKAGGYYNEYNHLLKIFIPLELAEEALNHFIYDEVYGEDSGYDFRRFNNRFMDIFSHEYAHLEQSMRNSNLSPTASPDFGYVTLGKKRGGLMRAHEKPEDYVRYLGNLGEIDAFAAGAASQIIQSIHDENPGSNDIEYYLQMARQDLAYPHHATGAIQRYYNFVKSAMAGEYDSIKLNKEEAKKVWQRFVKRVYERLSDQLNATSIRIKDNDGYYKVDPKFMELVKDKPSIEGVKSLARDLVAELKTDGYINPEGVLNGYSIPKQDDIEEFIARYYFKSSKWEPRAEKAIDIFRRFAAKMLEEK